ncbi:MAG: Spy/CpxP family protein refolding chaperone [Methylocella sp.]
MKTRLSLLMTAVLASGLTLAAVDVNAQEPHPGMAPPPPGMGMEMGMEGHGAPHPHFSPADRAAFFDAHIAGLHAGLELTAEQEKLWPPVDAALRAGAKSAEERIESAHAAPHPTNAIAWLRKLSEEDIAKGETLKALADAAAPLYDSLSDDQKHRLPFLLHGIRPHGFGAFGPHGDHHGDHDADEGHGEPE